MIMLAERVDVVIGIDTHKHTHTAAVVAAGTGASLETVTVCTDPDGYRRVAVLEGGRFGRCGGGGSY